MENLHEGQKITGEVSRIVEEAAFVYIGASQDGFIPRRELDTLNPEQRSSLRVGESIEVVIAHVPKTDGNPLLTISDGGGGAAHGNVTGQVMDVWGHIENMYHVGDVLDGTVKTIKRYGAFVELPPGVDGLIHVSEMQEGYTSSPYDVVSPGMQVKVRIIELDVERERIGLSMKEVD